MEGKAEHQVHNPTPLFSETPLTAAQELRPFIDKRVTDDQIRRHKQLMRRQRAIGM